MLCPLISLSLSGHLSVCASNCSVSTCAYLYISFSLCLSPFLCLGIPFCHHLYISACLCRSDSLWPPLTPSFCGCLFLGVSSGMHVFLHVSLCVCLGLFLCVYVSSNMSMSIFLSLFLYMCVFSTSLLLCVSCLCVSSSECVCVSAYAFISQCPFFVSRSLSLYVCLFSLCFLF